ncbi:MAG: hypothetical protein KAX81_01240 [Leadbetterella sp.]|jgi:hypothetical protein|nr:hypothetical protein [Leadbetterella sp.]
MKMLTLLAIMAFAFTSCEQTEVVVGENFSVSYKPTQCSEAWDEAAYTDKGNLSRQERFILFLKNKGVTDLKEFKNTQDNKVYCSACTCPSNDLFSFKVSESDLAKLKTFEPFKTALK